MSDGFKRNLRLVVTPGKANRQSAVAGFTLLEILAIVAILDILASIAIVIYQDYKTKAKNSAAVAQITNLSMEITNYRSVNGVYLDDLSQIPGGQQLDPWQQHLQYLNIENVGTNWQGKCRRGKSLNPLNTNYDLYSIGADGQTAKAFSD